MKLIKNFALGFAILAFGASSVQADVVISNSIEDAQFITGGSDRNEMILNHSGTNAGRYGAARFDATILAAKPFTNSALWTLTSATLRFHEESVRNANNAAQSGTVGGYFMNTAENSDWTTVNGTNFTSVNGSNTTVPGAGWFGNSNARDGNFGGGAVGNNNADNRTNGAGNPLGVGVAGSVATINHTFAVANSSEVINIDLTLGGASLPEIQSILADWVAGNNAGMGLYANWGNQGFFTSMSTTFGNSVFSSIDGVTTGSGLSLDGGGSGGGVGSPTGGTGAQLILNFTAVPEPGSLTLLGLVGLGLFARRRK